jgi:hypothetical protein
MIGLVLLLAQAVWITRGAQSSSWVYSASTDSMTGGTVKLALVRSTNTVTFGFPYGGPQRATLRLRNRPRYGEDVILTIERGQFLCSSFEGCKVLVRFGEETATEWSAVEPADHSTTGVFINPAGAFIERLRDAKTVRIAAQFFQEGEPVFIFNVAGLVW